MVDQLKLLGLSGVLTVLIWTGANSLVSESASIDVSLRVRPDPRSPGMRVESIDPTQRIVLHISGPRKEIDNLRPREGKLTVDLMIRDRQTGRSTVQLLGLVDDQWQRHPSIAVTSVEPGKITVDIDHMIDVDVQVEPGDLTLPYNVEPVLDPQVIQVSMRESRFSALTATGRRLTLVLDVEKYLQAEDAGRTVTKDVPVVLDGSLMGTDARCSVNTIKVTASIEASRRTASIIVPVWLAVGFKNLGMPYKAVSPEGRLVTQRVTVTGPVEDVERLERGDTRAIAVILLKDADFAETDKKHAVKPDFWLPPRIELVETPREVEFRLVPVDTTDLTP